MDKKTEKILGMTDHTLLRVGCTKDEIRQICEDAVRYHCASVCIPPCFVAYSKECIEREESRLCRRAVQEQGTERTDEDVVAMEPEGCGVRVCTVIGFPNGYNTAETKAYEAAEAKKAGADEVDMVINVSLVKDRDWDGLRHEIGLVRKASEGIVLKVIIETCLLTDEEKVELCGIVTECGADYIKTSTGFSTGGATVHDVALLRKHVGEQVGVKAAGGIHTLEEAQAMIDAGASRLGASSIVKAVKEG